MMLTKEECKEALSEIEYSLCELEEIKAGLLITCLFDENLETIKQLIEEHFSNPPLTFEELKEMKNKPVWNNVDKQWCLISDIYKPFVLNQFVRENAIAIKMVYPNGDICLIGINCDEIFGIVAFKENCFYRKEVKDD